MSKFIKYLKVAAVVTLSIGLLSACGGKKTDGDKKILRLASDVAPNTLNQIRNSESINSEIIGQYLEGLVQYNDKGELVGAVAKDWEVSEDGLTFTFNLRPESKWDNGDQVKAEDFVFAWGQLATDKEAAYGYLVSAVQNGQAILDGKMDVKDLGVKAESDTKLVVTLEKPVAYFLDLLAFPPFYPVNEAFFTEVGGAAEFGTNKDTVMGNGPFKLTKYKADEGWAFEKNESYWDAKNVDLDGVDVRFVPEVATHATLFEKGEIDHIKLQGDNIEKFKDDKDVTIESEVAVYYFYLSGDTTTPDKNLANKNVRAAIAHAIDKTVITNEILQNGSLPADYIVPKDFVFLDGKDFRDYSGKFNDPMFDVKKAQELLDTAKKELGTDTIKVTINLADTDLNKKIYENIEAQLEQNVKGLDVTLNQVPAQSHYPILQEYGTPSGSAGWGADYMDAATYFEIFRANDSHNYGKYNNPKFDKAFEEAQSAELSSQPEKRWDKFVEAEETLLNDYAIVPIYQRASMQLVKKNVKGFKMYPTAPDHRYKFVTMD